MAVPWIAEFQAAITAAAKVQRNPDLHDWIARYAYHHPDGNAFAPEQRIITPNPAIALPAKPVSFGSMIEKWANYTNAPKKGRQNMETKCGDFIAYLGHDNMAQVTFENCRDYRDFLIDEDDLASSTIGNYLKALKALFTYAFDNYPDDFVTNAMARIKYQAGDGEERDDFIPEERARILTAAREAGPVIRWLNWLSSFNGGRLSELVEADTRDIVMKERRLGHGNKKDNPDTRPAPEDQSVVPRRATAFGVAGGRLPRIYGINKEGIRRRSVVPASQPRRLRQAQR